MKISNKNLLIATKNPGKIKEINALLNKIPNMHFAIRSLQDYNIPEADEPYETFEHNVIHKAKYYANLTQMPALSDDSGLCVDALDGFPGVRSKEFIVEYGGISAAVTKLEQMLQTSGTTDYRASLHCVVALYIPENKDIILEHSYLSGTLVFPGRGTDGFGFDSIFIPEGFNNTLAQLGTEVKNTISHRYKAMQGLLKKLKNLLQ